MIDFDARRDLRGDRRLIQARERRAGLICGFKSVLETKQEGPNRLAGNPRECPLERRQTDPMASLAASTARRAGRVQSAAVRNAPRRNKDAVEATLTMRQTAGCFSHPVSWGRV